MEGYLAREMMEENERIEIKKELRYLWLSWVACSSIPFVFFFICGIFGEKLRENIEVQPDYPIFLLRNIFTVLGGGALIFSYFVRKWFFSYKSKLCERMVVQMASRLNKPTYLLRYRNGIYLPMVISSSLCIFGFVLFILGANIGTFCVFMTISILGLLYHRPKEDEIIVLLQQEKKQQ